jgi:hypothetical protein
MLLQNVAFLLFGDVRQSKLILKSVKEGRDVNLKNLNNCDGDNGARLFPLRVGASLKQVF